MMNSHFLFIAASEICSIIIKMLVSNIFSALATNNINQGKLLQGK